MEMNNIITRENSNYDQRFQNVVNYFSQILSEFLRVSVNNITQQHTRQRTDSGFVCFVCAYTRN